MEKPASNNISIKVNVSKKPEMRTIFISATSLVHIYSKISKKEMDNSLFLFGSKRMWIFPENDEQRKESSQQGDYLNFPVVCLLSPYLLKLRMPSLVS
jgi:hypothetical protein